jgi:hypothetical protein
MGSIKMRIKVQARLNINVKTSSSEKSLRHGSPKAPAEHMQDPVFKLQDLQKYDCEQKSFLKSWTLYQPGNYRESEFITAVQIKRG